MRLVPPTGGWAVGDGGLLMTTHDLGRSWQTPPTDLPAFVSDCFNFRAVAVQGTHVWVAGSPGTRIFHSPDNGKTWESITTGQTTPIRALTFIDNEHGWAAGDLGNILVTGDGGHTWKPQRTGGRRAALLALLAAPTDVPLELLADSGAADGYIAAVNILCRPSDTDGAVASATIARTHEAMLRAGAASSDTAWRFPLPAADLSLAPSDLMQALNRENDGRALQQLESHIVRQLRTWRPDVVVTYHSHDVSLGATAGSSTSARSGATGFPSVQLAKGLRLGATAGSSNSATTTNEWTNDSATPRDGHTNINALLEQLILHAIDAAADPTQHPELANDAGLTPWSVKKVYGILPPGQRGDELLATGRFSPWLGATLCDFVSPAQSA